MPAGPGENLLTTLFADVHYHLKDPAVNPPHHRFDRGSYVYLFQNPTQGRAKLEIANHAGTPEQDAFHGYLDTATVRYSHLQPALCTIEVGQDSVKDQTTWHLPSYDESNKQKYMYKLHTLDIYLWTERDATTFMSHVKKVLPAEQIDIKHAPASAGVSTPHSEHLDSMSPVVQQLERTAVGTAIPARTTSSVSAQSFPGPPTPQSGRTASPQAAPGGYNPAAPAAPEPVSYREKTPPPPDDGTGTGLGTAARYDTAPLHSTFQGAPTQHAYFSGPPSQASNHSQTSLPGPPGSVPPIQQQQRQPSFGPMAASTLPQSPPPSQQSFHRQSSYGSAPGPTQHATYNPQQQYANYPGSPGQTSQFPPTPSAPPAYAGHTPLQSPGIPPPPPGQPQQQHQAPVGGYSNYSYSAAQAANADDRNSYGAYTGNLHEQAYRPTEQENAAHGHKAPKRTNTGEKPSKLQNKVGEVEGKVGKYLNKLDKLW